MRRTHLLIPALLLLLPACASGPSEDELQKRFEGLYCNGFYKLELRADKTYRNQRITRSVYTGQPVFERCEGAYVFERNANSGWDIVFQRSSDNSNKLISCEGRITVWNKEGGYTSPDSALVLRELTEQVEVKRDECD